jgi:hypothetical protein
LIKQKYAKIPCKDCLCLPICKTKSHVKCSILYKWTVENIESWGYVHKYMPKWMGVTDEAPGKSSRGIIK